MCADGQTQGHGGRAAAPWPVIAVCLRARPRVEKAPLQTAEGSGVEALVPFGQVR